MLSVAWMSEPAISPTSSRLVTSTFWVGSPRATAPSTVCTRPSGTMISRGGSPTPARTWDQARGVGERQAAAERSVEALIVVADRRAYLSRSAPSAAVT